MPLSRRAFRIEQFGFHNERDSVPEFVVKRHNQNAFFCNKLDRSEDVIAILIDFARFSPGFIGYVSISFRKRMQTTRIGSTRTCDGHEVYWKRWKN